MTDTTPRATDLPALPQLPQPYIKEAIPAWTGRQMQAYAREYGAACIAALAAPAEPVAWQRRDRNVITGDWDEWSEDDDTDEPLDPKFAERRPLYATPQPSAPQAPAAAPQQPAAEVQRLREALEMAIRQNEHDMLMTGEELRKCRAALGGEVAP